ncbi:MAG: TonB-dependent receptor [Sphingobacterium sp.]
MKRVFVVLIFLLINTVIYGQQYTIRGTVTDLSGRPLVGGSIQITNLNSSIPINSDGSFQSGKLEQGDYQLIFSHLGYQTDKRSVELNTDLILPIVLASDEVNIQEVFVSAKESKELGTGSIIDREAMELLQPSSFSDLLALLPGGRSTTPQLTENNRISLREADPSNNSNYFTGSLGTQFSIDGAIINNSASLGSLSGLYSNNQDLSVTPQLSRDNTSSGVDMRSISTDNIEKVEILRGIVSAEYGNLTSGVVLIDLISGETPWRARMKADGFSKLFSVGKGFHFKEDGYKLNVDGSYLNSLANPTDLYTSYKRVNISLRGEKTWTREKLNIIWDHSMTLNTTIDGDRFDPDNDWEGTDSFEKKNQQYSLANKIEFINNDKNKLFRNATISANVSFSNNIISQDKLIQAKSATLLINSTTPGSHEVSYATPTYVSKLNLEDRPITAGFKMVSNWQYMAGIKHFLKLGVENNYSKNIGHGQQFDLAFPPSLPIAIRPRAFNTIPAQNVLSLFAEDNFTIGIFGFKWENQLGMRAFSNTNLDSKYDLANQVNVAPRWNTKLNLPTFFVYGEPLKIAATGGYGQQVLTPSLAYLYPEKRYTDIAELSYYHNNPAYRLGWATTAITDPTNYALQNATAKKWELGIDMEFNDNRLKVTYFRDRMQSGFRRQNRVDRINFKEYDNTSVDPSSLTQKPDITDFEYNERKQYDANSYTSNGSMTDKEGIEYQFTSKRLKGINTRFTVDGAWFKTLSYNSQPLLELISSDVVTNNQIKQYYAEYADVDGVHKGTFNTNVMIDTYLPRLGLSFAISAQSLWRTSSQTLPKDNTPIRYWDINGNSYNYTEQDRTDPVLRYFDKNTSEAVYRKYVEPIDLQVNLKATKSIKKKLKVAMFVNGLITYLPDYEEWGIRYRRRNNIGPYFGMELNLTI